MTEEEVREQERARCAAIVREYIGIICHPDDWGDRLETIAKEIESNENE